MTEQTTSPVPATFSAGETLNFVLSVPSYPPSQGYSLTYYFRGASQHNINGVTSGDSYSVTIPANTITGTGLYLYEAYAIKGGERRKVDAGRVTITPDLAAVNTAVDARSKAEIILEKIDSMLAGTADLQTQMYTIGNRQLSRFSFSELVTARETYAKLVAQQKATERMSRTGEFFKTIKLRFTRTS